MRGGVHDDTGTHVVMVDWNRDANTTVAIQSVNVLYTRKRHDSHMFICCSVYASVDRCVMLRHAPYTPAHECIRNSSFGLPSAPGHVKLRVIWSQSPHTVYRIVTAKQLLRHCTTRCCLIYGDMRLSDVTLRLQRRMENGNGSRYPYVARERENGNRV